MTWAEVDMPGRLWNIPAARCKNGRQHSVPLADPAIAVLRWLAPAFGELSGPVFEPQSFSRCKKELDGLAGFSDFTIHDLRRTFASGCARLGVAPHIIESCINHKSGIVRGVAAIYNKYQYGLEKKAALDLWAAHVSTIPAPALLVAV